VHAAMNDPMPDSTEAIITPMLAKPVREMNERALVSKFIAFGPACLVYGFAGVILHEKARRPAEIIK
jgi:hypothetical protein